MCSYLCSIGIQTDLDSTNPHWYALIWISNFCREPHCHSQYCLSLVVCAWCIDITTKASVMVKRKHTFLIASNGSIKRKYTEIGNLQLSNNGKIYINWIKWNVNPHPAFSFNNMWTHSKLSPELVNLFLSSHDGTSVCYATKI